MSHFHTPSFGDEEFELTATPTLDPNNFPLDLDIQQLTTIADPITNYDNLNIQDTDVISSTVDNFPKMEHKFKSELVEPKKPVSAYAAFFRDTQNAIKGQNPDASFDEVSKIVASMWQALDQTRKESYNRTAEIEKRDYLEKWHEYKMNFTNQLGNIPQISMSKHDQHQQNSMLDLIDIKHIPIASKPAVFCINKNVDISSSTDLSNFNSISELCNNTQFPDNLMEQQNSIDESDNFGLKLCQPNLLGANNTVNQCIREECTNTAIVNPDWEDEYCSNECVVTHCRNVFSQWMQNRRDTKKFST